jgi:hypothetical protein
MTVLDAAIVVAFRRPLRGKAASMLVACSSYAPCGESAGASRQGATEGLR